MSYIHHGKAPYHKKCGAFFLFGKDALRFLTYTRAEMNSPEDRRQERLPVVIGNV